jgi:SRSO17 transposase
VNDFADAFKTTTRESSEQAKLYLQGLLTDAGRKNMEVIDGHLGAGQYESLQQFVSGSPWSAGKLLEAVSMRASQRLGDHRDTTLSIDESAHTKKGCASCGVARQYNGRLGKQDNCQVGVYSSLQNGGHSALIGAELYLPKEWIEDEERCRKSGVPEERIASGLLTKIDLARKLVGDALAAGVGFGCVCVDALYGRDGAFRAFLRELGLTYCCDIAANTRVFEDARRPVAKAGRPAGVSVSALAEKLAGDKRAPATRIDLREGENGIVSARVWARRVWVESPDSRELEEEWLIIRLMPDGTFKYTLSNAASHTSIRQLAKWSASRFYVERTFQDAKSHAGMSDYQCRGWKAWHHHMAMVCLATLFLMEERLFNPMGMALLSAHDIVELLDWAFRKKRSAAEMIEHIHKRHDQRARNAATARVRKRRELAVGRTKLQPNSLPK